MSKDQNIQVSVVVPLYNERENAPRLYSALHSVLTGMNKRYEIIFIDDGSKDGTRDELRKISQRDTHVRSILLRRNFGQSAAMAVGFKLCRGEIVVTMDGDLQNDPKDIPMLLEKIKEGHDVVAGWRKDRKDKLIIRKVPSQIANKLICSVTDIQLHDTGCALKAFRKEVIKGIRLYGELHRFLPALSKVEGARITEVVVDHHPRQFGKSKYNITRTFRVLMDLSSLNIFLKYIRNPLRYFGRIGVWFLFSGTLPAGFVGYRMVFDQVEFITLNVLVTLVFLLWVAGLQFFFLGLVASLIVRTGQRHGVSLATFLSFNKEAKNE